MQVKKEKTITDILNMINDYYIKHRESPSLDKIAEKVGVSKSTVCRYVAVLEERGLLERNGRYGSFKTDATKKISQSISAYPVVGDIACGTPILAEQNIEYYVNISRDFLGNGNFFILRAKGDSMINAGIADGDLVVVKQQNTAEEGQIVVALVDDNGATLKRYYLDRKHKRIRLHPENDEMEDMFYKNIDIQGIAVKVLKDLM